MDDNDPHCQHWRVCSDCYGRTHGERMESEIAQLRADLARVTAERDARPAITAEDAARVASWMDASIFDGIDEAIDPPAWAYSARDALRAHAAGSGKGGDDG